MSGLDDDDDHCRASDALAYSKSVGYHSEGRPSVAADDRMMAAPSNARSLPRLCIFYVCLRLAGLAPALEVMSIIGLPAGATKRNSSSLPRITVAPEPSSRRAMSEERRFRED